MMDNLKRWFSLEGKTALVTGAASGLGMGIAKGFAQVGASVALVDVDETGLCRTTQEIQEEGGTAVCLYCDVSNSEAVAQTVDATTEALGKIDILVNNAGIGRRSPAQEMTDEMWDAVLGINLSGAFYFCREVGREMIRRGQGGRMINIASIGGVVGVETGNANYAASKGGMIAMTRCLAIEWAKYKILVNAIAPSHTRTPLIEKLIQNTPETYSYFLNNIPLGRLGEVEDIIGPTIFLASPAAGFITGHVLLVDGGHTAK
jgi:NAD(P)-dependent dehydrogenase (short-subunit alcohol dehydrogenase family)